MENEEKKFTPEESIPETDSPELDLESILAEDSDSVPDPEPTPLPISIEEDPMEENVFEGVTEMATLDAADIPEPQPSIENTTAEADDSEAASSQETEATTDESSTEASETEALSAEDVISEVLGEESPEAEENEVPNDAETAEEENTVSQDATVFFSPIAEEKADEKDETVPEEAEVPKVKVRKIRPKGKKGHGLFGLPHLGAAVIWGIICVVIGITLGVKLWVSITDLMAFGKPDRSITITITPEDVKTDAAGNKTVNIDTIAKKLKDAGLIEDADFFVFFATKLTDKYLDIDAGTYTLNSKLDYNAMINAMVMKEAPREQIDILIPEGYTCAQIFSLLEEKGVCKAEDLEKAAAEGELGDYWFLEGVTRGDKYCLEGYLFPDTYRFYIKDEPVNVLKKFLDGFDYRFTDVMREKLQKLNELTGLNYTIREVVIIASMIEKETGGDADSYMISHVIYNRLKNPSKFMYLGIDATIYYALGGNLDPETGLPKPLTKDDLNIDHPYNTYNHKGLPPGAISNPGRNALDAALTPDQHSYPFYICYNGEVFQVENPESDIYWEKEDMVTYYFFNSYVGSHIYSTNESDHDKAAEYRPEE